MTMEPWQSWTAFLAIGGAVALYYANDAKKAVRPGRGQGRAQDDAIPASTPNAGGSRTNRQREDGKPRRRADTGNREQAASSTASGAEDPASTATTQSTNKGKANKSQAKAKNVQVAPQSTAATQDKEEAEDKDWAERLAGLKKGTTLAAPARKEARSKTVKQTAANAEASSPKAVVDNRADSDEVDPSTTEIVASGRDVSDMLEAPTPGPSVLRVTESAKPKQAAQKSQPKQMPVAQETKKQRQNRRKVEQAKQQREEVEKERRVLLEQQLRTAREARGDPAKNGLQPAKGPQSSAWAQGQTKEKVTATTEGSQLLDTFEQDGNSTSSSNAPNSVASTATTGPNWGELPPEEEQVRLALEDSSWNTVPSKRARKRTTNGAGDATSDESNGASNKAEHQPVKESEPAQPFISHGRNVEPVGMPSIYDNLSNPNDSEWSVV